MSFQKEKQKKILKIQYRQLLSVGTKATSNLTLLVSKTPPQHFNVLREEINKICLVYLEDIIIFGTNLKQHVENIRRVFKKLKEYI